jgi:hypothetical protein
MNNKIVKWNLFIASIILISINCSKVQNEKYIIEKNFSFDSVNIEKIDGNENKIGELIQYEIPFDNSSGVPFDYDEMYSGYIVEGFDVDDNGLFYFLGGQTAIIACFKENRQIFRQYYGKFRSNDLHIYKDKIFVFDNTENRNNLFVLNRENGEIERAFKNIIINSVNNYSFLDSSIVLRVFNDETNISIATEMAYVEFDLEGNMISTANGQYNLPEIIAEKVGAQRYLGIWKESYVFYENKLIDFQEESLIFYLYDDEGELIQKTQYSSSIFGKDIYGMEGFPEEHKKLKNDKIYWMGKKENSALISIISVEKLFQMRN